MENNRLVKGKNTVVASARKEASQIGIDILKKGGNAVDAAVATGFALGVCEPSTSGIGGGGFMMIKSANHQEPILIDFREVAPEAASADMWKVNSDGSVVDNENSIGGKSVGVPGEVAGLIYALENYGTMSLKEVMEPAIRLAEEGFVITDMMCNHFFEKPIKNDKYYDNLQIGQVYKNPDLANTLRIISVEGKNVFYEGEIAKRLIKAINDNNGLLTKKDLSDYKVFVKKPVVGEYRGFKIYSSSLPSSGGTHIIQMLNILENFDISAIEVNSADYIHLFSEAMKVTYSDRAKYMADERFYDVPVLGLTSKVYAKEIADNINLDYATIIKGFNPWDYEHNDTTHYSVGDKDNNIVAVTKTINHFCGSRIIPEGTGFILNDTMADFSTDKYSINAPEAFKKPLSSMSPTIIMKGDKPFASLGSPGGEKIICIVAQVISKLIDHHMNIDEAIASPRFSDNLDNKVMYENRISQEAISQIEKMGHPIQKLLDFDIKMGGVQGIVYLNDGIEGSADPRRDGKAIGI